MRLDLLGIFINNGIGVLLELPPTLDRRLEVEPEISRDNPFYWRTSKATTSTTPNGMNMDDSSMTVQISRINRESFGGYVAIDRHLIVAASHCHLLPDFAPIKSSYF